MLGDRDVTRTAHRCVRGCMPPPPQRPRSPTKHADATEYTDGTAVWTIQGKGTQITGARRTSPNCIPALTTPSPVVPHSPRPTHPLPNTRTSGVDVRRKVRVDLIWAWEGVGREGGWDGYGRNRERGDDIISGRPDGVCVCWGGGEGRVTPNKRWYRGGTSIRMVRIVPRRFCSRTATATSRWSGRSVESATKPAAGETGTT